MDCWNGCNKQQGKCDWCGTEGWCCRIGWTGNGCDGLFGGSRGHLCVSKPGKIGNQHGFGQSNFPPKNVL